jgi:hypothetical protein
MSLAISRSAADQPWVNLAHRPQQWNRIFASHRGQPQLGDRQPDGFAIGPRDLK